MVLEIQKKMLLLFIEIHNYKYTVRVKRRTCSKITFGMSRKSSARKLWTTGTRWKNCLKKVSFGIPYAWKVY